MTFKMLMKYYIQHEQWIRIRLQTPIIHHIKPEIAENKKVYVDNHQFLKRDHIHKKDVCS